jgi:CBS domain-containing protein
MQVSEIMTTQVISVHPDTKITEAAKILLDNHINGVPVVDKNNKLLGILCQSDIIAQQKKFPIPTFFTLLNGLIPLTSMAGLEKQLQKISATEVSQAMTSEPISVKPEASLEDVAEIMVNKNYHTLPVVKDGKLVGIIGKEDVLKTLTK